MQEDLRLLKASVLCNSLCPIFPQGVGYSYAHCRLNNVLIVKLILTLNLWSVEKVNKSLSLYLSFFSTSSWRDDSNLSHFSLSVFSLVKVRYSAQFGASQQFLKGKVKGKEPYKTRSRNSSWIINKWNFVKVTRPLLSESNIYIQEVWLGFMLYLFIVSVKTICRGLQRTTERKLMIRHVGVPFSNNQTRCCFHFQFLIPRVRYLPVCLKNWH